MQLLWKNKYITRSILSSFISFFGDTIFYLAMITFASTTENPTIAIMLVSLSEMIPRMIEFIVSHFATQTRFKFYALLITDIAKFTLYLFITAIFYSEQASSLFFVIVVINFVSDLFGKYRNGLNISLFTSNVPENMYQDVNAVEQFGYQLINMIALLLGGFLVAFIPFGYFAFFNALLFLLAALIMFGTRKYIVEPNKSNTEKISLKDNLKLSLNLLIEKEHVLKYIIYFAFLNAILSSLAPIFDMLVAQNKAMIIGSYSITISLLSSSILLGFLIGNIFSKYLLKNPDNLDKFFKLSFILVLFIIVIALFKNTILLLSFNVIFGITVGAITPMLMTIILKSFEDKFLSVIIGIMNSLLGVLVPLLNISLIILAGTFSVNVSLIVLVVLVLALLEGSFTIIFSFNDRLSHKRNKVL